MTAGPASPPPDLQALKERVAASPGDADALLDLARGLYGAGDLAGAEPAARKAVDLVPDQGGGWLLLGQILRAKGQVREAFAAFRQATEAEPGLARAWLQLATLSPPVQARQHLDEARRLAPEDALVWLASADLDRSVGDLDAAGEGYARAAALSRNPAEPLADLGGVRQLQGDYAGARVAYREAHAADPGNPRVRLGLAQLYELDGRYAEGLALLEDALSRRPPAPSAAITAARLLRRLGRGEESLGLLDSMGRLPEGHPEAARLDFVRGDLLHDQGRYPDAFRCYQRANQAKGASFDPAAFHRAVETLIAFFTPERMATLPRLAAGEDRPVFIVGMPRSGTTVLERILGAHPAVAPLGERPDLFRAVREFTRSGEIWPGCLEACGVNRLEPIARSYLGDPRIEARHRRVIDKMPGNVLHLGLAALLFPGARVIEARRDPMDAGWSCFSQDFQAESLDYTRDLGHIGYYYQGMQRLLEHWRRVLPLSFTAADHERLVAAPEDEIRRLLDFLDLSWQPGLLDFHREAPASITASFFQVKEPLNARGIGRHRPYAAFLAPLADALARPWEAGSP